MQVLFEATSVFYHNNEEILWYLKGNYRISASPVRHCYDSVH